MIDFEPATRALAKVVEGVREDQLSLPTPCEEMSVATILDHVDGLALAFTQAADKTVAPGGGPAPQSSASNLTPDWRTRIPQRLAALADAWSAGDAWAGMTYAGPIEMPAEIAAYVAIDEVVVHGWDLAVATGQDYAADDAVVQAALGFVEPQVEQNPNGTPGLFGARVDVPEGAPPLHRLIGATGRDPGWRAPA
jgi:uncharacterized protein (TIGR03086 family)